jgi:ABC-2 type transport system ATP-binding protein
MLTSHDLADVESLCERIILIDHAEIQLDMPLDKLMSTYGQTRNIIAQLAEPVTKEDLEGFLPQARTRLTKPTVLEIVFTAEDLAVPDAVNSLFRAFSVQDLKVSTPSVEDIVRAMYEQR